MIPKTASGSYAKCLILLALLMPGCALFSRQPPPALTVCPAASLAECDTSDPATPATAAEISADFALDLATFFKTQRNLCAALNRAKAACLTPGKEKPR